MSADDHIAILIGRIYEGALDPVLWPEVLEDIAISLQSICCHFFIADIVEDRLYFGSNNRSFTFESVEEYHSHYRHLDPRLPACMGKSMGRAYADWELIPTDQFLASEFYNDFYIPHGLKYALVGIPDHEAGLTVGVCVARPRKGEPFSRRDVRNAQLLFPHLARATRLMKRTAEARSIAEATAAALDKLPTGFLIVDQSGRVLFRNTAARRMIEQGDGLGLTRRGILASKADESNELRRAIGSAASRRPDDTPMTGGALTISRPSGRPPYQIMVTPLVLEHHSDLPVPCNAALVAINDPEIGVNLPEQALAKLFHFTPAEAKLAVRLMQGQSLSEIAEASERSIHTVRWTLKNLLSKTDSHNQLELLRRLVSASKTLFSFDDQDRSER